MKRKIAEKIFRIGKQSLWYDDETSEYYIKIVNRSYRSVQPIPRDKAEVWKEILSD